MRLLLQQIVAHMGRVTRSIIFIACFLGGMPACAGAPDGQWHTSFKLFGEPKYAAGFDHLDYVNPNAPKGGQMVLASVSGFDTLNAFLLKGVKAPNLGVLYESMMTGTLDDPEGLYPLLALRYRIPKDGLSMEFEMNPKARWHDGKPITPEDVVFSHEVLISKGDPIYKLMYAPLVKVEKTGEHNVRFMFADAKQRERFSLAAGMPVLPKHYYDTVAFDKTTLTPPLGSGPYKIGKVEPARSISYVRVKDYWGADLPVNIGQNNFDMLRFDVYRDESVTLEAFKSGQVDLREEYLARNWATAYKFPAAERGEVVLREVKSGRPKGMQGFMFNVRQPEFSDRRVREAISLAMDFEWMNRALFYDSYARNVSFFPNTEFEATGEPSKEELALLEPFKDSVPPAAFGPAIIPPKSDGTGNNRPLLVRAQELLNEAGWKLGKDGVRHHPKTGEPLLLEFFINQPSIERVIAPMRKSLIKLGIQTKIRVVDDAQYQKRVDSRQFDILSSWINISLFFPGAEQEALWQSAQADIDGSNNVAGLKSPAVDDLVKRIKEAQTIEELRPAARALDRVLRAEHVMIPQWHSPVFRLAYWPRFGMPEKQPPYGLATGAWWSKK